MQKVVRKEESEKEREKSHQRALVTAKRIMPHDKAREGFHWCPLLYTDKLKRMKMKSQKPDLVISRGVGREAEIRFQGNKGEQLMRMWEQLL